MAKDTYHETVKLALVKDGWIITDDPLSLSVGERTVYVDIGSQRIQYSSRPKVISSNSGGGLSRFFPRESCSNCRPQQ